mgnify:CR=1 FL=1
MGMMVCILAAFSAASTYGLKSTARMAIAAREIDTHHGVPAYTWMCSMIHCITDVGPHP